MSRSAPSSTASVLKTLLLATTTISLSIGLISFNSYLMKEGRFPYAAPLVLIHMMFCSIAAGLLRLVLPSLFPSLTCPDKRVVIDGEFVLTGILPIAIAFATSLVLSNMAYHELSVSFLQMMKESGIIFVYMFSLIAGSESFSWKHVQVIVFAIFAASLTIKGEMHFQFRGLVMQMTSTLSECMRIVLQSILLSGRKLDALSYVLLVAPICTLLLGVTIWMMRMAPDGLLGPSMELPPAAKLWQFGPLLIANCTVAFILNVSIAQLIKATSAMSYIFVGVVKDVCAVIVSIIALKNEVSPLQCLSFTLQASAVIVWSLLKMEPLAFQDGICIGLYLTLHKLAFGDPERNDHPNAQGKVDKCN